MKYKTDFSIECKYNVEEKQLVISKAKKKKIKLNTNFLRGLATLKQMSPFGACGQSSDDL